MKNRFLLFLFVLMTILVSLFLYRKTRPVYSKITDLNYKPYCSSCHGENLGGGGIGPSLLLKDLKHGNGVDQIAQFIKKGKSSAGMPGFANTLSEAEIRSLAIWISEIRTDVTYANYNFTSPLEILKDTIQTEAYRFTLEVLNQDLDPWPYAIEQLPDGSFLVTEKTKGLSIISPDGVKSDVIKNTPEAHGGGYVEEKGLYHGNGWMLDVVLHPRYEENGWVYLSYGDRCEACNEESKKMNRPVSMCKLVRGRIRNGEWIDEEVIWETGVENYTATDETAMGGKILFDAKGYLYLCVGAKKYSPKPIGNSEPYVGIQDLTKPYGKVYRLHDDGRIPTDNPYYDDQTKLSSIWTYGHRSLKGIDFHPVTKQVWISEQGPRGGDEINLLKSGRNFGWPLHSKGLNYNGTKVEFGKYLGIETKLEDIEQPKFDLTPSPAVSSIKFYDGDQFPQWKNNLLQASLKAATLYRYVIDKEEIIHKEILIKGLARIRDLEIGNDGLIYLLLEHQSGGQLVRLNPVAED